MVDDPLAGLQRPVPNARSTQQSVLSSTGGGNGTGNGGTGVAGGGGVGPAVPSVAPMIDATKLNPTRVPSLTKRDRSHQSVTRIEGMDQLEKPIMMLEGGESGSVGDQMTEAERRMKEEELSFYSASDNDHGDDNIWGLLSGVGGNIYEW
jgi:hypothetical protein